jgi:hypothetical protein
MRPLILALLGACYQATPDSPADEARPAFVPDTGLDTGSGPTPPPPLTASIILTTPGTVGAIQADPTFCWLTGGSASGSLIVDILGLGSGQIANLQTLPAIPGLGNVNAIFRERDKLVVTVDSSLGGRALVLDAPTGALLNDRPINPISLHTAGGSYVEEVSGASGVKHYTSVSQVLAGTGTRRFPAGVTQWGNGDVAFPATWHSTDTVKLYDPTTLAFQREVVTRGFNTWVVDVQLEGNRIYLLDDGRSGFSPSWVQLLWVFNATTGAHLRSIQLPAGSGYGAFVCRSAP